MKIAVVLDGLGLGGIERVGVDYIRLFRQMGHEVDVYNVHPSENLFREQLPTDVGYHTYQMRHKLCPELYSFGVKKWWWGKFAYPLLHTVLSAWLYTKRLFVRKKKYDYAIAFSGHINDLTFVAKNFVKAKKKVCWCHGSMASYIMIHDGYVRLYQQVDKLVTLSDVAQKDALFDNKMLRHLEVKKIYNPTFIAEKTIDESEVARLKQEYGKFVLMSARLDAPKDHKTAMDAVCLLKDRGWQGKLVFIGNGPKAEEYRQYAETLGISDLCVWEGFKSNTVDYNAACYAALLSSKSEGLPTVMVEAMTLGKPCIMTYCDDGEVSDHGKYAILLPIGDAEKLADAIEKIYADADAYAYYAQQACERAKSFSPSCIKAQLEEFLD